jgi:hypothetical protein
MIAKVIAETPSFGLAPSFDDLVTRTDGTSLDLSNRLEALIELKIGRVDVPNSKPSERRFAFAHPRYQVVLYVSYLKTHGVSQRPHELLTDPRWREYAVTFLQSQSSEAAAPLLAAATSILKRTAGDQPRVDCDEPLGKALYYFDWSGWQDRSFARSVARRICQSIGGVPGACPNGNTERVEATLAERRLLRSSAMRGVQRSFA